MVRARKPPSETDNEKSSSNANPTMTESTAPPDNAVTLSQPTESTTSKADQAMDQSKKSDNSDSVEKPNDMAAADQQRPFPAASAAAAAAQTVPSQPQVHTEHVPSEPQQEWTQSKDQDQASTQQSKPSVPPRSRSLKPKEDQGNTVNTTGAGPQAEQQTVQGAKKAENKRKRTKSIDVVDLEDSSSKKASVSNPQGKTGRPVKRTARTRLDAHNDSDDSSYHDFASPAAENPRENANTNAKKRTIKLSKPPGKDSNQDSSATKNGAAAQSKKTKAGPPPAGGLKRQLQERDDKIQVLETANQDLSSQNEDLEATVKSLEAKIANSKDPQVRLERRLTLTGETWINACTTFQNEIRLAISSLRNTLTERRFIGEKFIDNPCKELWTLYRTALGCSLSDDWDAASRIVHRSSSVGAWEVLTSIVAAKVDGIWTGERYGLEPLSSLLRANESYLSAALEIIGVDVAAIGKYYAVVRAKSYECPRLIRPISDALVTSLCSQDINLHLMRLFDTSPEAADSLRGFEQHLGQAFTAIIQLKERATGLKGKMRFFFPKPGQEWDRKYMEDDNDLRALRKDGPVALTVFPGLCYTSEDGIEERIFMRALVLRDAKSTRA